MKKQMYIGVAAALSAMMLFGCGKKEDVIQPLSLEATTAVETDAVETTAETTAETTETATTEASEPETEVVEFIYVPSPKEFEVFYDGEPHEVLFYADEERTLFSSFTSVSRPDLGIKSVSFPSLFVEEEGYELGKLVNDTYVFNSEEDSRKIYDFASYSSIEDSEYIRIIPVDGRVGIISIPTDIDPSKEEIEFEDFYPFRKLHRFDPADWEDIEIFEDVTRDGNTVYGFYICSEDIKDMIFEGFACVRIQDGKMEGAYYLLHESYEFRFLLKDYLIQSLVFED